MRKLFFVPVYIITKILNPFLPDQHPWKGRNFSLDDWNRDGTSLALKFSIAFWFQLVVSAYTIYKLTIG